MLWSQWCCVGCQVSIGPKQRLYLAPQKAWRLVTMELVKRTLRIMFKPVLLVHFDDSRSISPQNMWILCVYILCIYIYTHVMYLHHFMYHVYVLYLFTFYVFTHISILYRQICNGNTPTVGIDLFLWKNGTSDVPSLELESVFVASRCQKEALMKQSWYIDWYK